MDASTVSIPQSAPTTQTIAPLSDPPTDKRRPRRGKPGDAMNPDPSVAAHLRRLTRRYRWSLGLTYGLFNVENILRLLQPLVLGMAINDLLRGGYGGLLLFAVVHAAHMALRLARQMFDTRVFTAIYTDGASELVSEQRARNVEVSRVAARCAMSRQYVEFLERHVPMIVRSLYSIVGALLMLVWFDPLIVLGCLLLAIPAAALNLRFGRQALRLSGKLHDQLEQEVDVVRSASPEAVRNHYESLARSQIRLSDWEAYTTGTTEVFVLLLLAAALLRVCSLPAVAPGDIYAVFRYVLMFIMGLDALPRLVDQISRLRDIGRRLVA